MEFVHSFTKVTVKARLGDLSDARIAEIHSRLKGLFPRLSKDERTGLVFMADSVHLRAVVLGPDDFTVSFDKAGVDPDLTVAPQAIRHVLGALLLADKHEATIRTVGTLPSENGDSMNETLRWRRANMSCGRWEKLKGIGLRLFYDYEGGLSELKVEPFLADPAYYYVESIVNLVQPSDPDSITAGAETALADIREHVPKMISQYFSEGWQHGQDISRVAKEKA